MIRLATLADLHGIQHLERAAGEAFRSIGMAAIADDEPIGRDAFHSYVGAERAWVAETPSEGIAAYILLEELDGGVHIEQVSRHPDAAGRGLGAALIDHADDWGVAFSWEGLRPGGVASRRHAATRPRAGIRPESARSFLSASQETPRLSQLHTANT